MAADRFRTQDTVVNEAGEFAAPVSLQSVEYESMIDSAAEPLDDDFVFDDEPAWNQPLAAAPERTVPQPAPVPAKEKRNNARQGGNGRRRRRGGWRYFKSERALQKYMRKTGVIGTATYTANVAKRFIVQVLLPNRLRGWVFKKFARKAV